MATKKEADPEFSPVYTVRLGEMLTLAKGPSRTMAEFAAECGFNPATFSRIVNGSIAKPLDPKDIRRIAEKAALDNNNERQVTLDDLMRANGMVRVQGESPRGRELERRAEANRQRREMIKKIIMQELFSRGYMIGLVDGTPFEELNPIRKKSRFHFARGVAFSLKVQGTEPTFLNFSDHLFTGEEYLDRKRYEREARAEAEFLISGKYQDIFLRDMWEPEAFESSLYTITMINKDVFEYALNMLEGIKVNNWFSLLLIDLEAQTAAEERILPRCDGKTMESFFKKEKLLR